MMDEADVLRFIEDSEALLSSPDLLTDNPLMQQGMRDAMDVFVNMMNTSSVANGPAFVRDSEGRWRVSEHWKALTLAHPESIPPEAFDPMPGMWDNPPTEGSDDE